MPPTATTKASTITSTPFRRRTIAQRRSATRTPRAPRTTTSSQDDDFRACPTQSLTGPEEPGGLPGPIGHRPQIRSVGATHRTEVSTRWWVAPTVRFTAVNRTSDSLISKVHREMHKEGLENLIKIM